ncbi:(deoxy)nucleoside triphosphate pyrophosphohydrolase [Microbacterium sp. SSW1-59]|uniref:(deoxy)nucleoside triphosphate pyrophosphohydrolase n=1 Tax=Microbacterium xanthum TaxID=3079794 RepID=UPI002AD2B20E|nr:(deoxy)nucleoside triphosphate pyrophosphohydrolase [Microbacterium sp. SSW1-59]MDZ8200041.1 (deoxy)nucleoside triphosphate pyrophosphohydrolase [Microbacterium sp. SSW1-59]
MTSAAEGPILDVVAAVIERDGLVLACRRRVDRSAGGLWEFPGGKVEPGEAADAALQREIAEELDVTIRVVGELTADVTPVDGRGIRLICLRAEVVGEAPTASTDHDELRWVAPADLPALTWAAPDLPAVALLASR